MNNEAIISSIDSLKAVYTVLLVLSLGEAFSQLVERGQANDAEWEIKSDRILNLVPFLLLIVPFIQGMDRYFFVVYKSPSRPGSYGGSLLLDCIAFTLEGGLFFILARSLSLLKWKRFYTTVIVLLALDAVWGVIVWLLHLPAIPSWLILDIGAGLLIAAVCFIPFHNDDNSLAHPIICLFIILARTIADYYFSWNFYFPSS